MDKRWLLVLVSLAAIGVFLVFDFDSFREFGQLVTHVNFLILALVIPSQYLSFWSDAKYYQSIFKLLGKPLGTRRLVGTIIRMAFVNTVFPSGGISGASYLAQSMRDQASVGVTTIAQVFWYVFTYLSFMILLVLGFVSLFLSNQVHRITVRLVLLVVLVLILGGILGGFAVLERDRTQLLVTWVTRPVNWFFRIFRMKLLTREQMTVFFSDFYRSFDELRLRWRELIQPFGYCLLGSAIELGIIYVCFAAFGVYINPGVVIVGYALAIMASLASVFTAGVGPFEAAMVATFVALGVPVALAVSVVLYYRLLAFWLFVPVGFYFYRRSLWTRF